MDPRSNLGVRDALHLIGLGFIGACEGEDEAPAVTAQVEVIFERTGSRGGQGASEEPGQLHFVGAVVHVQSGMRSAGAV